MPEKYRIEVSVLSLHDVSLANVVDIGGPETAGTDRIHGPVISRGFAKSQVSMGETLKRVGPLSIAGPGVRRAWS